MGVAMFPLPWKTIPGAIYVCGSRLGVAPVTKGVAKLNK